MKLIAVGIVLLSMIAPLGSAIVAPSAAQPEPNQTALAKMEELGTVYVTRRAPSPGNALPKTDNKKGAIIGVDFRPMAGSDPKKIVDAVKGLATFPDLEFVLLLGKDVTDAAADALPTSTKLTSVQFFNTAISDKGVTNLTRLTNLQVFKFTGMGLSDQGMKELAKIRTLHTIEVTDSKVSDEGILALSGLPNLIRLNVENTAATQQSIDQLRNRLPRIESRRTLR